MLATQMCLAISRGDEWLGFQTTKSRVLYLQLEVPPIQLHNRMMKMMQNKNGTGHENFWLWYEPSLLLDTVEGAMRLEQRLEELRPQVLVIDPVYKVVTDTDKATTFINQIDRLKDKFGLSILMVHHPRKEGGDAKKEAKAFGFSDDMLGASTFLNWADSIIRVERKSFETIKVSFENMRNAEYELPPREFDFNTTTLSFTTSSGRKV